MKNRASDDGSVSNRVEITDGVRRTYQDVFYTHPGCLSCLSFSVSNTLKPTSVLMNMAKKKGWTISGNKYKNRICPEHKPEPRKETPMAEASTIPTDAARAQRRQVFFELDNSYEGKAYKPGFSDQTIATKLKVSVGMVKTIREENFGPAGHDGKITELHTQMVNLERRIDTIETNILTAMESAETIAKTLRRDLASLKDQLNKLEGLL